APSYGGGGGGRPSYDDISSATSHAESHSAGTGSSDLFQKALGYITNRHSSQEEDDDDIDESQMVQSHQAVYNSNEGQQHDSKTLGAGAAMQALKMFTSGSSGASGSGGKNEFIGLAMAQASKLWEEKSSSGMASGDKQSAINQAAEMALKMYMKSQGSGSSGTGGPAGLLSLASKFL
ncbi:uncharacterized protein BO95DRAFT_322159, partial [Aspergillus brunneoviolaceus CBS 621.78]